MAAGIGRTQLQFPSKLPSLPTQGKSGATMGKLRFVKAFRGENKNSRNVF
jgi:hypothetical protein